MGETELERLMVRLVGDGSSYQAMIAQAEKSTARLSESIQFHSQKIAGIGIALRGYGSSVAALLASGLSVVGAGLGIGAIGAAVMKSSEFEQINVAFESLVGNATLAKKTMADLYQFAAETPFQFMEVAAAAKQMIAFGGAAEDIVPTMRKLGDVSAALEIPLGQLTYLYGTLRAQGRAFTVDINQFAMRGIPIWQELQKITGKSNVELRAMVEAGQVGFPLVDQAFENMTKAGGQFSGMLEKQGQTLKGLFSTLKDDVTMALAGLGDKIVDVFDLKQVIRDLDSFAKESARWVDFLADRFVEAGRAVREFMNTSGVEAWQNLIAGVRRFADENQKLMIALALSATAVLAVVATFKLLQVAILTTLVLADLLKLDQVAGAILWVAYAATMLAAKLVMLAFSGAQAVAAGTTGVLAAALALLSVEVVPLAAGLTAAGAALGVIAVAAANAAAGAYGVYKAASGFLDVLLALPSDAGPIKAVGDLFKEWEGTVGRVAEIAKTDLPAAWELSRIAFQLAVSQVKDLMPPLWDFVERGWQVVWKKMKEDFVEAFKEARLQILTANDEFQRKIGELPGNIFRNFLKSEAEEDAERRGREIDKTLNQLTDFDTSTWQEKMDGLVRDFDASVRQSDATTELKKKLEEALDAAELEAFMSKVWDSIAANAVTSTAKKFDEAPITVKVTPKFDAAAWNSGEAAARIAEFRDRLGLQGNPRASGRGATGDLAYAASGFTDKKDVVTKGEAAIEDVLKKMLEKMDKRAGLGGTSEDEEYGDWDNDDGDFDLM